MRAGLVVCAGAGLTTIIPEKLPGQGEFRREVQCMNQLLYLTRSVLYTCTLVLYVPLICSVHIGIHNESSK